MKRVLKANINKHVGQRLKHRRLFLNMSQRDLAEAIGVTFQAIQKYENGSSSLTTEKLLRICDALDTDCKYLLQDAPRANTKRRKVRPGSNLTVAKLNEFLATRQGTSLVADFLELTRHGQSAVESTIQSLKKHDRESAASRSRQLEA